MPISTAPREHTRRFARYRCMAIKVVQVPDEVLTLAAVENGPRSAEAHLLARLRFLRAKDRQVFAFRVGDYLIASPVPDARTELAMIEIAQDDEDEEE
jgi:hypothetical protein